MKFLVELKYTTEVTANSEAGAVATVRKLVADEQTPMVSTTTLIECAAIGKTRVVVSAVAPHDAVCRRTLSM